MSAVCSSAIERIVGRWAMPDASRYVDPESICRRRAESRHARDQAPERGLLPNAKAAEVLKKAQDLDNTEHTMIPFIEKFKSIKDAVAKFGRI